MKAKARRKAQRDHAHRQAAKHQRPGKPRPSDDDPSEPVDCADTVDALDLQIARTVKGYDE